MSSVLIIIPAYNEEDSITHTVSECLRHTNYDYIVINDGSTDNTVALLRQNKFHHLNLPVNLGIGGAMQAGYRYALEKGYEYAIQLDGDGQHDPRDIAKLMDEMHQGSYDMVIGSRFVEKSEYQGCRFRRLGIGYFTFILRLCTRMQIKDPTSGYRLVNRRVIQEFSKHYPTDYPEVEVLFSLTRKKYRMKEVSVTMKQRNGGHSSINFPKSVYYMCKVTLFSLIRWAFQEGFV